MYFVDFVYQIVGLMFYVFLKHFLFFFFSSGDIRPKGRPRQSGSDFLNSDFGQGAGSKPERQKQETKVRPERTGHKMDTQNESEKTESGKRH